MDGHIVVGAGNIYAAESLFRAGIRPTRRTGKLTRADCARLADRIREVLAEAVERGGTTLRDFFGADGASGRSEEHTSELQSLMRISYAVFCLKKKKKDSNYPNDETKLLT